MGQVRSRVVKARSHVVQTANAVLPDRFFRHYVTPLLVRRRQVPYDAKAFFESYHRSLGTDDIADRQTISPDIDEGRSRYHYNAVENSIIQYLAQHPPAPGTTLLDIGSGSGHWIDFYRDVFGAGRAVGVEISGPDVELLRQRYAEAEEVTIVEADIADEGFRLDERFGIVNAVGVMFHIVDDDRWARAVRNLADQLTDNGVMFVGGQFGWLTQNVQFHEVDRYSSFEELRSARSDDVLVNKRIRSRWRWRRAAAAAGLSVVALEHTQRAQGLYAPENNVLVLRKTGAPTAGTEGGATTSGAEV
jgi:SAM-dependent methyltransferase